MTLLWDFNGTLLDDAAACVDALNTLLRMKHLPQVDLAFYHANFKFPVADFYASLGMHPAAEKNWDAYAESFHMRYLFSKKLSLQPGAREAIQSLHARGIRQGVLSALEQGILEVQLRQFGLANFMSIICGSHNYDGASKIDAARALNLRGDVVLVGDTLHDAQVAQALGWHCILCSAGHQTADRLAAAGVPVIPSLFDLDSALEALNV